MPACPSYTTTVVDACSVPGWHESLDRLAVGPLSMTAKADAQYPAIAGLPQDVHVSVHVCQGNCAIGKEYDARIGRRHFDVGRREADIICDIDCSSFPIGHDTTPRFRGSCGFNHLPQATAFGRLKTMAEAWRIPGG